jgi:hypothetical protein
MKFRKPLLLSSALLIAAVIFFLNQKNPTSNQNASRITKSENSRPAPLPKPIMTAAGFEILETVNTSDAKATDALLARLAVSPEHLNGMREENAFVRKRQLIRLPEKFADLATRIEKEGLKKLDIPDFDGKTISMDIRFDLTKSYGDADGVITGDIPNQEMGDVILSYFRAESTGYINMPTLDRVLEYEPQGDRLVVLKDIDSRARNIAQPCSQGCMTAGHIDAEKHKNHVAKAPPASAAKP